MNLDWEMGIWEGRVDHFSPRILKELGCLIEGPGAVFVCWFVWFCIETDAGEYSILGTLEM